MRFILVQLMAAAAAALLLCALPSLASATQKTTSASTIIPEEAPECSVSLPVYAPFGPAATQRASEALAFLSAHNDDVNVFQAKGLVEVSLYAMRNAKLALESQLADNGTVKDNADTVGYLNALLDQLSSNVAEMSATFTTPPGTIEILRTVCELISGLELPASTIVNLDDGVASDDSDNATEVIPERVLLKHYGVHMPLVGIGTWDGSEPGDPEKPKADDALLLRALNYAIASGVRLIDTAESYANHHVIKYAMSGLKRADLFIVDKISDDASFGSKSTRKAVKKQMKAMGVKYVDLVLLHHMIEDRPRVKEAWLALELMVDEGLVKAIGVSNFDASALDWLMENAVNKHPPAVLQNKFHPFYRMMPHNPEGEDLVKRAKENGMVFVGHSMLRAWPFLLDPLTDPHIIAIANTHKVTPAQVVLRWALQKGIAVIPRSVTEIHIVENSSVGSGDAFVLSMSEMQLMEGLEWMIDSFSKPYSPDVYGIGPLSTQ